MAVAFLRLPDRIGISFSITGGAAEFTDSCSTFIYIVVGAFFVLPSVFFVGSVMARALYVFLLGGGAASQAAAAFSGCSGLSSWLCLPVFPCGFTSSSVSI